MLSALRIVRKMIDDYFYYNFDDMTDEQRLGLTNILDQIDNILRSSEDF